MPTSPTPAGEKDWEKPTDPIALEAYRLAGSSEGFRDLDLEASIATALRAARIDALEEAAVWHEGRAQIEFDAARPLPSCEHKYALNRLGAAHEGHARAIRSLKSTTRGEPGNG
jgi:hypothetical protein